MADVAKPKSGRDTNAYETRWFRDNGDGTFGEEMSSATRYWDTGSLTWVKGTQPGAGGGGGGPATIADGADVAEGTTTDPSSANTVVGILKAIKAAVQGTLPVSGTFWQATQPVSMATNTPDVTDRSGRLLGHVTVDTAPTTAVTAAALPLPAGAATDASLTNGNLRGTITVANPTANPETGLAKDATLTGALGAASDSPATYTILDQLNKMRKLEDQQAKLMQQLVALQTPAIKKSTPPTLLHRS